MRNDFALLLAQGQTHVIRYSVMKLRSVHPVGMRVEAVNARILGKPIQLQPENTAKVVLACVHLHNFLRKSQSSSASYSPPETFNSDDTVSKTLVLVSGGWEECPRNSIEIKRIPKKPSILAKQICEELSGYITSAEDSVSCSAANMASGKKREELKKKTENSIRIGRSRLHSYATQMAFRPVSFATKNSHTIRSQIWRDTSLQNIPSLLVNIQPVTNEKKLLKSSKKKKDSQVPFK
ncbi:hypothetical protein AVEN_258937-1 [Araneus ventricosus]|uniref:DDE Tnp4 domain-containing protein n=1 Tax=Araneus ventricosus TaxID=182803 RepID=A0A4Y2CDZ5_ARAVE|nr:hypothetical protein AVEN_258937-1 [Araneus ventricosus]